MSVYVSNGEKFKWGPGVIKPNPEKIKLLSQYARRKVLDVGCGSGAYSSFLSNMGLSVVGVDQEPIFVKKAVHQYPGIEFLEADIIRLPFSKKTFDTVILFDILEHVDDLKALKEASRVGKRLIISVPHQNQKLLSRYSLVHSHYLDQTHLRTYTAKSLSRVLQKSGLKVILCQPSLPISLSGLLVSSLSGKSMFKRLLLKILLKPFLPEPPIYSTVFAVAESV